MAEPLPVPCWLLAVLNLASFQADKMVAMIRCQLAM
jgi:hypothetical protein